MAAAAKANEAVKALSPEEARYSRDGRECILIGHAGHPEVDGTRACRISSFRWS